MKYSRHKIAVALLLELNFASAAPLDQQTFQIQWHDCNATLYPRLQCGGLKVPMDWDNPNGDSIVLDILRYPTNGTNRIGSMFANPGGPGGSAIGFCTGPASGEGSWPEDLLSHFDIICPEPRGVGASSKVECDPDLWMQTPSYFIDDEAAFEDVMAFNKKLGESCLNMTGPVLGFVDTASAAKDLDAIRQALGEEKMNWFGYSYGTQLGAAYAELFPDKIRAMVLDGIAEHGISATQAFIMDGWAMEDEVARLLHWCDTNSTCAFHNVSGGAVKAWTDLIANGNKNPIPAPGCGPTSTGEYSCKPNVTGYDIIFNLENDFHPKDWQRLSVNIKAAMDGNATLLANDAPKNVKGLSAMIDFPNLAIGCLDWDQGITTFDEHKARVDLGKAMFPLTQGYGMAIQWATTCIGWPFPPTNPQHQLDPEAMSRAPPIMLLQSTHDPATPVGNAYTIKEQMPSGVMVLRAGDGHTSYGQNPEIMKIANAYLVNLTLPEPDLVVYDVAMNPGGGF